MKRIFNKKFWVENKYLIIILVVAFLLRVWGIDFGLPDFFPHTDETFALSKAMHFFEPELRPEMGVTVFHLWGWLLYQILTIGKFFIIFTPNKELTTAEFMWWARLINAMMSIGSVWLVYLIGKRLGVNEKLKEGNLVGLLAAVFLAVTFIDVQTAHYFRQDTYIQFLGLLLLYAYLKQPKRIFLWVFLIGIVGAIRITAWIYLVPIIIDWWFSAQKSPGKKVLNCFILGLLLFLGLIIGHPDAILGGQIKEYISVYLDFYTKKGATSVTGYTAVNLPNWIWWIKYLFYTGLTFPIFILFICGAIWLLLNIIRLFKSHRFYSL